MKNVGIRIKIISITLLFLGVGLFIAPGVLVDIAELRFKQVIEEGSDKLVEELKDCLLYTSPSPRDVEESRMPSSA